MLTISNYRMQFLHHRVCFLCFLCVNFSFFSAKIPTDKSPKLFIYIAQPKLCKLFQDYRAGSLMKAYERLFSLYETLSPQLAIKTLNELILFLLASAKEIHFRIRHITYLAEELDSSHPVHEIVDACN